MMCDEYCKLGRGRRLSMILSTGSLEVSCPMGEGNACEYRDASQSEKQRSARTGASRRTHFNFCGVLSDKLLDTCAIFVIHRGT